MNEKKIADVSKEISFFDFFKKQDYFLQNIVITGILFISFIVYSVLAINDIGIFSESTIKDKLFFGSLLFLSFDFLFSLTLFKAISDYKKRISK